jgi:uncharacterized protein
VVPAVALAFVILCFYLVRHRRPHRKPPQALAVHISRLELVRDFTRTIQLAGGESVWVTSFAIHPESGSLGASEAFRVWALPPACDRILESAKAEAQRQQMVLYVDPLSIGAPGTIRHVRLAFRGVPVLQFQLHEIPRMMRVAIVVDDLGQNMAAAQELTRMHSGITLSIMPHLRYSRETADAAHRSGEEVMLHVPMQPIQDSAPDISQDELRVGMRTAKVSAIIRKDLGSVPFVAGVNNHMGSRATADIGLMKEVMSVLAARHLYFVDSVTTGHSVALKAARQLGVSSFYRSVFLDDQRSVPYTLGQLHTLCRVVEKRGSALAIGHPYPTTIEALRRFLPKLEDQGIQLVPASRLVR